MFPSAMADLTLDILPQPDDTTCGPTCLQAVYGFYGDAVDLHRVIAEVTPLATGGTLGVFLGIHALRRGYGATLYTYNLEVFDLTWFDRDPSELSALLVAQAEVKADPKVQVATAAYLDFLALGGRVRFQELGPDLIRRHLLVGRP
ncbi:MAG: hypothetical protein Q8N53_18950, partial [Longimicrobiales bacterium]|nr:hypothetical protein [Longimicrobiales bacterium]